MEHMLKQVKQGGEIIPIYFKIVYTVRKSLKTDQYIKYIKFLKIYTFSPSPLKFH